MKAVGLRKSEDGNLIPCCILGIPSDIVGEKIKEWVITQKVVYDEVLLITDVEVVRLFL